MGGREGGFCVEDDDDYNDNDGIRQDSDKPLARLRV